MADSPRRLQFQSWMIIPLSGALLCALAALFIRTSAWIDFFVLDSADETRAAAAWRIMLFVSAVVLAATTWVLSRTCRPVNGIDGIKALPRSVLWGMTGLVVIGVLIRLTRIGESLWYDEIAVLVGFAQLGPGRIMSDFSDPGNHIAHTLLTWLSVRFLGIDEAMIRLPALVFSLLSIPAIFGLTKRAADSNRLAMIAAAVVSIMPIIALEGVEARGYSMMIFFAAASTCAMFAAANDDKPIQWLAWAVLSALGAWSHLIFVLVPIGHAVWIAGRAMLNGRWRLLSSAGAAAAVAVSLAALLYSPALDDLIAFQSRAVRSGDAPLDRLGPEASHLLWQLGGSWFFWAAIPGLILTAAGIVLSRRSAATRDAMMLSWLGAVIGVAAILIAARWTYARFLLFAAPGTALAIALALDWLWSRRRAVAVIVGCVLAIGYAGDLAVRPPKQPLRDAVEYVASSASPDDFVLTAGLTVSVIDYYMEAFGIEDARRGHLSSQTADAVAILNRMQPRWVIVYYPREHAAFIRLVEDRGFTRARVFPGWVDWSNGDVIVFQRAAARQ